MEKGALHSLTATRTTFVGTKVPTYGTRLNSNLRGVFCVPCISDY